jgi:diaminohydroxyphosphoribosylaminopyrimidine deaminase / 5-amino-6-(5-phosphoribosylamino)uracil reductase
MVDAPAADAAAAIDQYWMRRALTHARRGIGRTTPNPAVGACVVTSEGVVVGQGAHERAGEPHAEIHALDEAGGDARGATLYCTLEPCAHTGRTGPCTERIIAAGIRRVVAAMEDPFPQVSGRGFASLRAHGIVVEEGVEREAALRLNQPYLTVLREGRPFVIVKAASSIDARIAAAPGERTRVTADAAARRAQYDRARVDAIGVGSETLLVDDPLLTVRDVYRERPLVRVVFDRRLRTPPAARVLGTRGDGPVILLTTADAIARSGDRAAALERAGATLVVPQAAGMAGALRELPAYGVHSLIVEGGAALHAAAWDAGVVDYVQLYIAPLALGAQGVPLEQRAFSTAGLFERTVAMLGQDVIIEGYVHRPH